MIRSNSNCVKNDTKDKTPAKGRPVAPKKKRPSARILAYALLSGIGGLSKREAKRRLGYSPTYGISGTKSYRTIQERITQACEAVGVSAEANLATLGEIAYQPDNCAPDRISAVKEINAMAGYRVPDRIEIEQHTTHIAVLVDALQAKGMSIGEVLYNMKGSTRQ